MIYLVVRRGHVFGGVITRVFTNKRKAKSFARFLSDNGYEEVSVPKNYYPIVKGCFYITSVYPSEYGSLVFFNDYPFKETR